MRLPPVIKKLSYLTLYINLNVAAPPVRVHVLVSANPTLSPSPDLRPYMAAGHQGGKQQQASTQPLVTIARVRSWASPRCPESVQSPGKRSRQDSTQCQSTTWPSSEGTELSGSPLSRLCSSLPNASRKASKSESASAGDVGLVH